MVLFNSLVRVVRDEVGRIDGIKSWKVDIRFWSFFFRG